jgi:hypothetical protein
MFSQLYNQQKAFVRTYPALSGDEERVLSFLLEWLQIFDRVFFFNSLTGHIRGLKLYENEDSTAKNGYWDCKTWYINVNIVIRGVKGKYTLQYVTVLLHEMVHAFLWHYSCGEWHNCPSKCKQYLRKGTHIGKTGQGALWVEAVVAIKQALEKALGWEVDCGFPQSIQNDFNWGIISGWTPSDVLLLSCGLKFSESGTRVTPIEPQK